MIKENILYRIALGIFAVHLLVVSSIFLAGEFILGLDYMVGSSVLSVAVYFFVFVKWISQLLIVISVVNSKFLEYKKEIFYILTMATILCVLHLTYVFYSNSQSINESIIIMQADSFKNIALFAIYIFFVNVLVRKTRNNEVK